MDISNFKIFILNFFVINIDKETWSGQKHKKLLIQSSTEIFITGNENKC